MVNRNLLCEVCGLADQQHCHDSEVGLIERRIHKRLPWDPNQCPLCPDNVICPLSTGYQMSVVSTEINLMSPEDMQLIF